MNNPGEIRRYTRSRSRRRMLDVDLNTVPPSDSRDQEGTSHCTGSQTIQSAEGGAAIPPPIDLEAFDDDLIISSPRAFAEAKNNSRRNRGPVVVDVESEERLLRNKRRRAPNNRAVINCDMYINLEGSCNSSRIGGQSKVSAPAPPPPPPKEPTFNCPICMGPLVEETSTKCGHIFCKECIKTAIATQTKCPTCRKRTTAKDLIRVYLPATRST